MLIPAAAKYLILHRYSGPPYGTSSSLCSSTAGWPSVLWRTWSWVSKRMNLTVSRNSLFSIGALTTLLTQTRCWISWQLFSGRHSISLHRKHLRSRCDPLQLLLSSDCVHPGRPLLGDNSGARFHFIALLCNALALQRDTAKGSTVIPSSFRMNS